MNHLRPFAALRRALTLATATLFTRARSAPGKAWACGAAAAGSHQAPRPRSTTQLAAAVAVTALLNACGGGSQPDTGATASAADGGRQFRASASDQSAAAATVNATTIIVLSKVTTSDSTGALVKLRYNGQVIAATEMRSPEMTAYTFKVDTVIDGGLLDIVFTNATFANGQVARVLTVSGMIVNGTPFAWYGPGITYDVGHLNESMDGINVLPATDYLYMTGALRFPMPAAAGLGARTTVDASQLSAPPGIYVDATLGDDNATGMREQPIRSLGRVAMFQLVAGENVYLACGGVWRETLALTGINLSDGTQIKSYGDCSRGKPVISGANDFSGGWSRSGALWVRNLPAGTPKISRLYVGAAVMHTAQWPNAGTTPATAVDASGLALTLSAAQAAELATRDVGGADILVRTQPWRIETRQVASTGLSGAVLPVSSATEQGLRAGVTFVLRDKAWMLDVPGEFFHDTVANKLYVMPSADVASQDPNALSIDGSVRDVALDLRDRRSLGVSGIALRKSRSEGLRMTNTPDAVVSAIEATDHGVAGVRFMQWVTAPQGSRGPSIDGSYVASNGEFGIDALYVQSSRITNNYVMNIGMQDFIGNVDSGITAGAGSVIQNNTVYNVGFSAIRFSAVNGSVVSDNEIRDHCRRLGDCGAIYTWSGQPGMQYSVHSVVERNRIHAVEPLSDASLAWGHNGLFGIYVDDYSNGVIVRDNFVNAATVGIFVHNSADVTVERNRVWMARDTAISVLMDSTGVDYATNTNIRDNEIVAYTWTAGAWPDPPTLNSSLAFELTHFFLGEAAMAPGRVYYKGNRVTQVHGEDSPHARIRTWTGGAQLVTAERWRQLNPDDPAILQPATYSPYWAMLGPELVLGGEFDTGVGRWSANYNWQIPGFSVQAAPNQPGCNGPCVRLTTAAPGDMIFSPTLNLEMGKPYVYSWTAVSSGPSVEIGWPYISRAGSPWDEMQDYRGFIGSGSRVVKAGQSLKWQGIFTPKAAAPARVNLTLGAQGVPVYFDSVSVRQMLVWLGSGAAQWSTPVIAPRDAALTVSSCGEVGLPAGCSVADLDGSAVSFPITVQANQQRLLLWTNSPYRK